MSSSLIWAVNEIGKIVQIDEVPNGLKCNCTCPICQTKLIAKQGKSRISHFAHENGKECANANETAIHKLAKEIIAENKSILLSDDHFFEYNKTTLEKTIKDVIVDAFVQNEKEMLIIEVAVCHVIDTVKERKLEMIGVQALEIYLSGLPFDISRSDLEYEILNNPNNRKLFIWTYDNPNKIVEQAKLNNDSKGTWDIILFIATIIGLGFLVKSKKIGQSRKVNRRN